MLGILFNPWGEEGYNPVFIGIVVGTVNRKGIQERKRPFSEPQIIVTRTLAVVSTYQTTWCPKTEYHKLTSTMKARTLQLFSSLHRTSRSI